MPRQEAGKMSEVLGPRGIPRYYLVACAPPSLRTELFVAPPSCSATRLPLTHRWPQGFAPPASGRVCPSRSSARMRMPCDEHTIHRLAAPRNTPWRIICAEGRCPRIALRHALSLSCPPYTAGCGDIDPCRTPCICERLSTPSDEGYARIMLRGSTTLKTAERRSSQNFPSTHSGE
jgi:hypothetical protein